MVKKTYKGKCVKKQSVKSENICRLYSPLQEAGLAALDEDTDIKSIICNYPLDGDLSDYTSDFFYVNNNGEPAIRECVERTKLTRPKTAELLSQSLTYWQKRGVKDWGMFIDEKK